MIIDLDLARFLWNDSPIGRRFRVDEEGERLTVVGVVDELRLMGRHQRQGLYQILRPASPDAASGWVELAVRTRGDPAAVPATVLEAVREIDPEQSIWRLRPAKAVLADDEAEPTGSARRSRALAHWAWALVVLVIHASS